MGRKRCFVLQKSTFEIFEVNSFDGYPTSEYIQHPDLESLNLIPRKFWKLNETGDAIVEMNETERSNVESEEFEQAKKEKILEIDKKTDEMIAAGFSFDGETFSLSLDAQQNWTGMQVAISQGYMTEDNFPFELSTLNNGKYYLSWSNTTSFFQMVLGTISTQLATGRYLKDLVESAADEEALGNIVDHR